MRGKPLPIAPGVACLRGGALIPRILVGEMIPKPRSETERVVRPVAQSVRVVLPEDDHNRLQFNRPGHPLRRWRRVET